MKPTEPVQVPPAPAPGIVAVNREFYDKLWAGTKMVLPERFNTWPLIEPLAATAATRLEVGPGMRPRTPIKGTHFIDLSAAVVERLNAFGGIASLGQVTPLPFPDRHFDLVSAFDIIEHTEDGEGTFAELARVLKPGGAFVFSVPLFMSAWNFFDEAVGHFRRFEPEDLAKILERCGFTLEKSAAYGMQPSSQWLLKLGIWWVRNRYDSAMAWYNRLFFPLALRFQKPLKFEPGMLDTRRVDEAIFVCRRIA